MRPAFEETLSYLTGLAPVGEPFEVPLAWVMADLGLRSKANWYSRLNGLIADQRVRRMERGLGRSTGILAVVRPIEPGRRPCGTAAETWRR